MAMTMMIIRIATITPPAMAPALLLFMGVVVTVARAVAVSAVDGSSVVAGGVSLVAGGILAVAGGVSAVVRGVSSVVLVDPVLVVRPEKRNQ